MSASTSAAALVAELVARHGPVPFSTFIDLALYDSAHGFYASGGQAGRRGDFLTSPEVGPLFGAVLARALDTWWAELGEPDPFVVVESGAGRGALAIAVCAAAPRCAPALHYVLVERSAQLRARQAEHLALTVPSQVLGALAGPDPDAGALTGTGPLLTSLGELPGTSFTGVVLANELLDNLAFDLLERTVRGWDEVRVGVGVDGSLVEVLVPASDADVALATHLAPEAPEGGRLPLQHDAARFLQRALEVVEAGRVVLIDYADRSEHLVARPADAWIRTYRGHETGEHPLASVGLQDVTCEVDIDQLARIRPPDLQRSQAELLRAHGIDDLVAQGRVVWEERGHLGDLEALRGRSRVREAEALCDPGGLGAFAVLEWIV